MKYKLVKLTDLSGNEASVYSIYLEEEGRTLYDRFLIENLNSFKSEIIDINQRLKTIGNDVGARHNFFKHHEGVPGDGVCALYDNPDKILRLYCIRYGSVCVVLGGGGEKPQTIRRLQESSKLSEENNLMKKISKDIQQKMKEGEIRFSNDGIDFEGDLTFNTYEQDD